MLITLISNSSNTFSQEKQVSEVNSVFSMRKIN